MDYTQLARQIILRYQHGMAERGLNPALAGAVITQTQGRTWLLLLLDTANNLGKLERYASVGTLHQISTLAEGRLALLSNSTGLRYGILLDGRTEPPQSVEFPAFESIPAESLPLGETVVGALTVSWQSLRSVMLAGASGSGKSTFLTSLANLALRQGTRIYLSDPEEHTFSPSQWDGLADAPIAATLPDLQGLLQSLTVELDRRSELFRKIAGDGRPPENLPAYNAIAAAQSQPRLARLALIMDEGNSFLDAEPALASRLAELARRGRKWGLNLILAAHNWRANAIPRELSMHFPTRICFRVDDDTSGVVLLGEAGRRAQRLTLPGRGILRLPGQREVLFQGYQLPSEVESSWQRIARQQKQNGLPAGAGTSNSTTPPAPTLTENERKLAQRAINETDGKMTRKTLESWGYALTEARRIQEDWLARGLLERGERGAYQLSAQVLEAL